MFQLLYNYGMYLLGSCGCNDSWRRVPRSRNEWPEWDCKDKFSLVWWFHWSNCREKNERFGILEGCKHCFCLKCIRKWRGNQNEQFEKEVIRSCPECRIQSNFVIPCNVLDIHLYCVCCLLNRILLYAKMNIRCVSSWDLYKCIFSVLFCFY